uniref:USP domain-containing protein n=1 Tax=viral metagenome TaxID=1070528 RepID=A0A6C0CGJ9_9ZZZZ
MNKKELIIEIKKLYPYFKNLQKKKVAELKEIYEKNCDNFSLKNERNSCYMDALFVALFHDKNKYISDLFFKSDLKTFDNPRLNIIAAGIKYEVENIYNRLFNVGSTKNLTCSNLRKLFNDFFKINYPTMRIGWKRDQLEPLDVINILDDIIIFKKNLKINTKIYGTNKKGKSIVLSKLKMISDKNITTNNFSSFISIDNLLSNDKIYLKNLFPKTINDVKFDEENLWKPYSKNSKEIYSRKIEKVTYLSSKLLFITVNRIFKMGSQDAEKIDSKVIPALKLKLKDNDDNLYLKSIIIHHGSAGGGHYTTLFNCKGKWYEYDDMKSSIDLIGNFEDLCEYNDNYYLKNCTNIIYY